MTIVNAQFLILRGHRRVGLILLRTILGTHLPNSLSVPTPTRYARVCQVVLFLARGRVAVRVMGKLQKPYDSPTALAAILFAVPNWYYRCTEQAAVEDWPSSKEGGIRTCQHRVEFRENNRMTQ